MAGRLPGELAEGAGDSSPAISDRVTASSPPRAPLIHSGSSGGTGVRAEAAEAKEADGLADGLADGEPEVISSTSETAAARAAGDVCGGLAGAASTSAAGWRGWLAGGAPEERLPAMVIRLKGRSSAASGDAASGAGKGKGGP